MRTMRSRARESALAFVDGALRSLGDPGLNWQANLSMLRVFPGTL
jgi:hypothetical protein